MQQKKNRRLINFKLFIKSTLKKDQHVTVIHKTCITRVRQHNASSFWPHSASLATFWTWEVYNKVFYTVKLEHGVRSIITLKQELLTKSNYLLNYNVKKYFLKKKKNINKN